MSDLSNHTNYVVAVSGGVDSVVLLDMLVSNRLAELTDFKLHIPKENLIVAHFDHGIRSDSSSDEAFTRGVAGDYELPYESKRVELGSGVSEEAARQMRYNFLRQCCNKYNATLITAHHQNDLIETMLLNLIRGTGWRGLVSLNSNSNLIRPLLNVSKSQIIQYAKEKKLEWREDSTNTNTDYLRNYIRHTLLPAMHKNDSAVIEKLLAINKKSQILKNEIATELQSIINDYPIVNSMYTLPRYELIMWPPLVALEIIYSCLTHLDPNWHPHSFQIKRALHFIKTGRVGKQLEISKYLNIQLEKGSVQFKKR